jgi:hypothetical protein
MREPVTITGSPVTITRSASVVPVAGTGAGSWANAFAAKRNEARTVTARVVRTNADLGNAIIPDQRSDEMPRLGKIALNFAILIATQINR